MIEIDRKKKEEKILSIVGQYEKPMPLWIQDL